MNISTHKTQSSTTFGNLEFGTLHGNQHFSPDIQSLVRRSQTFTWQIAGGGEGSKQFFLCLYQTAVQHKTLKV